MQSFIAFNQSVTESQKSNLHQARRRGILSETCALCIYDYC